MNRFENVDVLAALEQLMRQNTAFYRNDFEIDKEIIGRAAASDKAEDRTLLWMSRPSGTHCFRESDVYLQGTRQHNTWKFYGEQTRDRVLAYAVELTGKVRGVIRGNLYELDYWMMSDTPAKRSMARLPEKRWAPVGSRLSQKISGRLWKGRFRQSLRRRFSIQPRA